MMDKKEKPATGLEATATTSVDGVQAITLIESATSAAPAAGARPKEQEIQLEPLLLSEGVLCIRDTWHSETNQPEKSSVKAAETEFPLTASHKSCTDKRGTK